MAQDCSEPADQSAIGPSVRFKKSWAPCHPSQLWMHGLLQQMRLQLKTLQSVEAPTTVLQPVEAPTCSHSQTRLINKKFLLRTFLNHPNCLSNWMISCSVKPCNCLATCNATILLVSAHNFKNSPTWAVIYQHPSPSSIISKSPHQSHVASHNRTWPHNQPHRITTA